MSRKWLLLLAIIPALACLSLGLLAAQGARAGGDRGATQTAAAQFFDPLRAICAGQAGDVAGATPYAPASGLHPVVAFRARDGATFDRDPRVGTGDWAPRSASDAQLVACLEERWVTIESCAYESTTPEGTRHLIRSQHQVALRLIAARSGESVATETLTGGEPRACQDTETFAAGTTRMTVAGEAVTTSAIQSWLQPYVAP
jgi:hypothetical protein